MEEDRNHRYRFWIPWEKLKRTDRLKAFADASQIVFSDGSVVYWTGCRFKADVSNAPMPSGESEADRFISMSRQAACGTSAVR